jgi:histone H3/H4
VERSRIAIKEKARREAEELLEKALSESTKAISEKAELIAKHLAKA